MPAGACAFRVLGFRGLWCNGVIRVHGVGCFGLRALGFTFLESIGLGFRVPGLRL